MKSRLALGLLIAAFLSGCITASNPREHSGTTSISLSGTAGDVVTGFYVQDGQHFIISNAAPWEIEVPRLSHLELHAPKSGREVVVKLAYTAGAIEVRSGLVLGQSNRSARVRVQNGFHITRP